MAWKPPPMDIFLFLPLHPAENTFVAGFAGEQKWIPTPRMVVVVVVTTTTTKKNLLFLAEDSFPVLGIDQESRADHSSFSSPDCPLWIDPQQVVPAVVAVATGTILLFFLVEKNSFPVWGMYQESRVDHSSFS